MLRQLFVLVALPLALVAPNVGCGGPTSYALVGSARSAGTDGTLEIEADEYGNFEVTVEVEHLPPPDRIGDNLTVYVVWFIASGTPAHKEGVLAYDVDDRSGHFRTHTNLPEFTVKITAERSPAVNTPSDVVVVNRRVSSN